jgi:folate-binding protein YgfZ
MTVAAYPGGHLSVWRGNDVLSFIDGLSTNLVLDLTKGCIRHTTFTTASAKVIDRVVLYHMGGFVAMVSHAAHWDALYSHVSPRILGQDVVISIATSNNNFYVQYNHTQGLVGSFNSNDGVTTGITTGGYDLIVASKETDVAIDGTLEGFHLWRIANLVPWPGFEITAKHHALACGLGSDVHPSKGCYIGQEVLTRMMSRGKQGRELIALPLNQAKPGDITTPSDEDVLAIVRIESIS